MTGRWLGDPRRSGLLAAAVLAIAGLLVALLGGDRWVLDHAPSIQAEFARWPALLRWLVRHSIWGFYAAYAAVAALGLWQRRRTLWGAALCYLVAELLVAALVRVLKIGLGRPRPFAGDLPWQVLSGESAFHSLPSGHSADAAVGCAMAVALLRSWWWRGAAILGLAVTMAGRVLQLKHYPSDVLAGAALGYLGGTLIATWWAGRTRPATADREGAGD